MTCSVADVTAWLNVLLVGALVVITAYYAKKTAEIVEESRKARKAGERQAGAAEASLSELRARLEEDAGLSATIVAAAIQTSTRNIEYWKNANIYNLATTSALPQSISLLPVEYSAAIQHARRLSVQGSVELAGAFDNLRFAGQELEILRDGRQTSPQFFSTHARQAMDFIEQAELDLKTAQEYLHQPVSNAAN